MEFIGVKTRTLRLPQDNLYAVFDESLTDIREGDVILISSKVIAIHQGRCIEMEDADKRELIMDEADIVIPTPYRKSPLTVKAHTFLGAAGIDESNGDGYYILPPENLFDAAHELHTYLCEKHGHTNLGVIITDSRSQPFRLGAFGVALSFWGFEPLIDHKGKRDLFDREMKVERSNLADGLAAGAVVVGGEVSESMPVVIARDVPGIVFVDGNHKDDLMVPPEEDFFRVLYQRFIK